ncbi:MAG: flagellar motor protein MotA [Hyphomicrobiaceae bacterium]|nr:flagellar motor protein MotA [Hyphomicrobiaceae bacterium]
MSDRYDPFLLNSPAVYLVKMIIFLILVGMIGAIITPQLVTAFWSNPFINGLIIFVLVVGILLSFRQVIRLFPEVRWVNSLQSGDLRHAGEPTLLGPIATILRNRMGEAVITPAALRSLLDSVGFRLDEARETSRYMTALLVFLGLLGTFYGLLQTVTSVAGVIQQLDVSTGDTATVFSNLKDGLQSPLGGMGTAFASSLFGLSGSLVLGFLDLQTGQAQNQFAMELEDWMSSMAEFDHPVTQMQAHGLGIANEEMAAVFERLGNSMQRTDSSQNAIRAMAELARGIDGLVKHIRAEQEDLRRHIVSQGETNKKLRELIEAMMREGDGQDRH